MALAKCPRCEKLFEKIRFPVCPICLDDEEADYDKVREALGRQPNLNAEQVSVETTVSVPCIQRMIKEGLIATPTLLEGEVKCGMCGAPAISLSKKLCQSCLEKLNAKVTKMQGKIKLSDKKSAQVDTFLGGARKGFEEKRR